MAPASSGRPARVLLVVTALDVGGAERIVLELASRLDRSRFEPGVASLDDASGATARALREAGVPVFGLDRWRRNPWACARAVRRCAAGFEADLLHGHLHHANLAARMASRPGRPVLTTVHTLERRFRPWHFRLDAWTASRGHAEICVSRSVLEHQRRRTGLPAGYFRLIENGVELGRFTAGRPAEAPPVVVSVGRLVRDKGLDVLLRSWASVLARVSDARLVLAGEGPERPALERLAGALPDGGASVSLPGLVDDVPALLAGAAVLALPSRIEGMPLAALEAQAAGLPIVGSRIPPVADVVVDGVHGRLVPEEDARALADAIAELLQHPEERRRLGAAGRAQAEERFDVGRMVRRHEELYAEALEAAA